MPRLSDRQWEMAKVAAGIVFTSAVMLFILTRLLGYVGPFVVALMIYFIINKPVDFIQKNARISRGIATAIMLLLFVAVVGGGLGFALYRLASEAFVLTEDLLTGPQLEQYIDTFMERMRGLYLYLPPEAAATVESSIVSVAENALTQVRGLMEGLLDFLVGLPRVIIFIVISMVATFFITKDKEKIWNFIYKQLPEGWNKKMDIIVREFFGTVLVYVKAQAVLSLITLAILLAGYTVLGLEHILIFALFTTLFDALPILGAGAVLGSAAFVQAVMGEYTTAAGFIGIYLIVVTVRHSIEPKFIGKRLGLHPLLILLAMYVGLQLFGAGGLLMGPLFVISMRALQKAGILPGWKV